MEKTVKSCGECPFVEDYFEKCNHPTIEKYFDVYVQLALSTIHPNCPEGGEFVITTKKLDNDKSK